VHVATFLTGPQYSDFGTLLLRLLLGIFFVIARYRWLYDPNGTPRLLNGQRHEKLRERLCTCGYTDHPCMCAMVALTEIFAGIAIAIGLLTQLALIGLLCVLAFAIPCKSREDIRNHNGEGSDSFFGWYMWNIEGSYFTIIIVLLLTGPGIYSLDHLLLGA
jgi:uncharacterized membrane protein YphA (DoxX/SURF4 family)